MKKNVGNIDRVLRIIFGVFLIWLGLFQLRGLKGEVLGILVVVNCLTLKHLKFHLMGQCLPLESMVY